MKKNGILNPDLCAAIARIGHTDSLVIADPGLPLPEGVPVIDLALIRGIPRFRDVLRAVNGEFVTESFVIASEMRDKSAACRQEILDELEGLPHTEVPHEEFKRLTRRARAIVRTGETTPYANVILIAGVNF